MIEFYRRHFLDTTTLTEIVSVHFVCNMLVAYVHTYVRTCIHTYMYIHTRTPTYIHTHNTIYTQTYARTHIHMYTYYIHIYTHTCAHTHTRVHTHTHTHTHTHAYVRDGSRNFRKGFPYHSQCSNFTVIFDGNYKFLPSIDLEKFYGQLIKKFEMEGVSENPKNSPKTTPVHMCLAFGSVIKV